MKAQLESIVEQMYYAGMRFDEALREFQKAFVLTVLRQEKGKSVQDREQTRDSSQYAAPNNH